jgi:hypothetical protein
VNSARAKRQLVLVSYKVEDEVIHATSETFGDLKKIRLIEVVDRHGAIYRKPKPRQYFIKDVLHREEKERKVSWYELFVDLIFGTHILIKSERSGKRTIWSQTASLGGHTMNSY